jgi:hypothetical protein
MMKRSVLFLFAILCFSAVASHAQAVGIVKKDLSQTEIDRIIKKVTENESAFREALTSYVFSRLASISTIGMGGQITGTYRRDSFMTFTSDGGRFEKVVFAPISTLVEMRFTSEDLEDLGGVNPFALDPRTVPQYNFSLLGTEHIDDLDLYVFDVTPKVIPDPKKSAQRLFSGRIWVDTTDLMIVKSKGKALPETKENKYPVVETWRENIDGKYWFPSDARSDDELVFDNGNVVKIRMRVKYTGYKVGRSDVRVLGDDEEVKPTPTPTPAPTPKKP